MKYIENEFQIITNNLNCPYHVNSELEFIIATKGKINVFHEGFCETIFVGEASLILPFHPHSFSVDENSEGKVIMFNYSVAEKLCSKFAPFSFAKYNFKLDKITFDYLNKLLVDVMENNSELIVENLLYTLFHAFLSENIAQSISSTHAEVFSKAMRYIYLNLDNDLSIGTISKKIGISPLSLRKIFSKYIGVKIGDFINNVKVQKSISLLKSTDLSITEIAFLCGFGSLRSFNRIFYSKINNTPSDFRKN